MERNLPEKQYAEGAKSDSEVAAKEIVALGACDQEQLFGIRVQKWSSRVILSHSIFQSAASALSIVGDSQVRSDYIA